jgi:GNAT superfamily N-acetyltransferase
MTSTATVRRVAADEWRRLRAVRLAALRDAPEAFSARAADEEGFDDAVWIDRATRGASDDHGSATFLLDVPGAPEPLGIAVGHRPGPDPHRVELVSMWVVPSERRTGAGRRLVDAVAGWAAATGATHLDLWVMRANPGAQAFYERLGFTPATGMEVAPDDPCRDEVRLTLPLQPA